MYTPKYNEVTDRSVLAEHIKSNPFGSWSCIAGDEVVVNHIPFVFHEDRGEFGTITGHVSRANPVWENCSSDKNSAIVFHGEDAYISPSWYPSKHHEGKAVPTWNYNLVQVRGIPSFQEDRNWLFDHIKELTDIHEKSQALPWKVDDAPKEYINRLVNGIIGIEIPISSIVGKWKLGQNRPESDQIGMVAGLSSRDDRGSQALGMLAERFSRDG